MGDWSKRVDDAAGIARKLLESGAQTGSKLSREFGGKWLPSAMKGVAQGFSGASKALNSGAKKLRKNVKTFQQTPLQGSAPALRMIPVRDRSSRR